MITSDFVSCIEHAVYLRMYSEYFAISQYYFAVLLVGEGTTV